MNLHGFLTDEIKIDRVMNAVAAGTTDQNGTGLDMSGYDGVVFIASFGALTANQVTLLKAQQSDDDGSTDSYGDLEGTATTALADTDGNKQLVLDIVRPRKKWVRPVIDRGTANAVIDGITAIRYRARSVPTSQGSSVAYLEQHHSPAEGTA